MNDSNSTPGWYINSIKYHEINEETLIFFFRIKLLIEILSASKTKTEKDQNLFCFVHIMDKLFEL